MVLVLDFKLLWKAVTTTEFPLYYIKKGILYRKVARRCRLKHTCASHFKNARLVYANMQHNYVEMQQSTVNIILMRIEVIMLRQFNYVACWHKYHDKNKSDVDIIYLEGRRVPRTEIGKMQLSYLNVNVWCDLIMLTCDLILSACEIL